MKTAFFHRRNVSGSFATPERHCSFDKVPQHLNSETDESLFKVAPANTRACSCNVYSVAEYSYQNVHPFDQ